MPKFLKKLAQSRPDGIWDWIFDHRETAILCRQQI
jgi:hypothetical protein